MSTAQKAKTTATNGSGKPKKNLSVLYKKTAPTSIPIQVPALGIDIELEFKVPDDEVKALLDAYLIHVARAIMGDTGLALTDEQLLDVGKNKVAALAAHLRKITLQEEAQAALETVDGVKNAELVTLRDRLSQLVKNMEYCLDKDYEEKETLSFHMASEEKALEVLYCAITKCFPEIENPADLTPQIKYVLALALLGAAGKTIVV